VENELNSLPKQLQVSARLESHPLPDPAAEAASQLQATLSNADLKGKRVAVALGSRGIDHIAAVAAAAIAVLKERGAQPFIIPSMGSHGGATPEGQTSVLEGFGISEKSMGVPIEASMETIEIGQTEAGYGVPLSRAAAEADAVLIVNRVKPHTDFASEIIGSGLRKMCVIGLGKADGSFAFHRAASRRGFEKTLLLASQQILEYLPNAYGLALVEDGYHRLARIEALTGAQIPDREPALLGQSRKWMPLLPFKKIDVLIVDEIGKNISGAGMDPNVIGRGVDGLPRSDRTVEIGAIYARGLTEESHGNAIGLGFADVVSSKLVASMDKQITYTNSLSSMTPASARIPMHFTNDGDCLRAALRMAGADLANARIVRINNTLSLDRFIAAESFAAEISERDDLEILPPPQSWSFTAEGDFAHYSGR
jgi:hypothetical protein